jgi:hypothetical protein
MPFDLEVANASVIRRRPPRRSMALRVRRRSRASSSRARCTRNIDRSRKPICRAPARPSCSRRPSAATDVSISPG